MRAAEYARLRNEREVLRAELYERWHELTEDERNKMIDRIEEYDELTKFD